MCVGKCTVDASRWGVDNCFKLKPTPARPSTSLPFSSPWVFFLKKKLNLRNNLLTSLDPWYFYLSSIETIDLSFNQISTFTNNLNWNLYGQSFLTQGRNTINMDLRYNNLKSFDDSILRLYDLCAQINVVFYMQLLYNLKLENANS